MITMDKQYKTRDGQVVQVLHILNHGPFPVIGIRTPKDQKEILSMWTIDGSFWNNQIGQSEKDLIEVKKEHTRTMWLNIYPSYMSVLHPSKEIAKKHSQYTNDLIACKEITFTYTEGEGL